MADKYKVLRLFPASITLMRGQVLESPTFRNLSLLVKQGYLERIAEVKEKGRKNEVPDTAVRNEALDTAEVEMEHADPHEPDMIEVDRPHVEHPEASIEAPALPPTNDVEVVEEAGEAFIPDEVAAKAPSTPKKPAAKNPASKPKSKESK